MLQRWIIRGFFILPILLCVAGWLWSGKHSGCVSYCHDWRGGECWSGGGVTGLFFGHGFPWATNGWHGGVEPLTPPCYWPPPLVARCYLGFDWYHYAGTRGRIAVYMLTVPYWFLILAAAALFFLVWRKTRPKINPATAFPVELVHPK